MRWLVENITVSREKLLPLTSATAFLFPATIQTSGEQGNKTTESENSRMKAGRALGPREGARVSRTLDFS